MLPSAAAGRHRGRAPADERGRQGFATPLRALDRLPVTRREPCDGHCGRLPGGSATPAVPSPSTTRKGTPSRHGLHSRQSVKRQPQRPQTSRLTPRAARSRAHAASRASRGTTAPERTRAASRGRRQPRRRRSTSRSTPAQTSGVSTSQSTPAAANTTSRTPAPDVDEDQADEPSRAGGEADAERAGAGGDRDDTAQQRDEHREPVEPAHADHPRERDVSGTTGAGSGRRRRKNAEITTGGSSSTWSTMNSVRHSAHSCRSPRGRNSSHWQIGHRIVIVPIARGRYVTEPTHGTPPTRITVKNS